MGTLRAPVVAVLLGSLLLQGCAVAALTILGMAGGAGIKHTLTGIAYKTFSHSVAEVRKSALHTLKHMAMTVTTDTKTETGWQIMATAENREIDIELERLTKHMTRMRAVANVGGSIFFKDAATSSAIITKTEEKLSSSKAVSASKARTSRRRPARRRRPPDPPPPSAPSMARVQADSASQTTVSWTAATDNVGVTAYSLSRNGTALGRTSSLSYVDTGLTATTTYAYIVTALDAAGNKSTPSAPVSATTLPVPDTTPPSAPSMAQAQADSASQTTVSWTAATDDIGVTAYSLTRNGTALDTTSSLSFVDTGLTAATTYTYIVTALDAAGNESTPSAPVSATTLPLLDTTTPSRNPQEGPSSLPFELHPLLQFLFP